MNAAPIAARDAADLLASRQVGSIRRLEVDGTMRVTTLTCLVLLSLACCGLASAAEEPWTRAAERLEMPVLAPTNTPKLTLLRVVPREIECGEIKEELDAYYRGPNGRRLRIAEGKPYYCGDLGDAPVLDRLRIHGHKAILYDYCEGTGCRKATHTYALFWREQGIQIGFISRGILRPALLAIARSMELVPDEAGSGG